MMKFMLHSSWYGSLQQVVSASAPAIGTASVSQEQTNIKDVCAISGHISAGPGAERLGFVLTHTHMAVPAGSNVESHTRSTQTPGRTFSRHIKGCIGCGCKYYARQHQASIPFAQLWTHIGTCSNDKIGGDPAVGGRFGARARAEGMGPGGTRAAQTSLGRSGQRQPMPTLCREYPSGL